MTYEDFTTYSETDTGGFITVDSAVKITYSGNTRSTDAFVVNPVSKTIGNFEYWIDAISTSQEASCELSFIMVAETNTGDRYDKAVANEPCIAGYFRRSASDYRIYLKEEPGSTSDYGLISISTQYYFKLIRSGTTAELRIYTDAARTSWVDTLTVTCPNDTLHYVYPVTSYDDNNANSADAVIENLDLNPSGAGTGSASTSSPTFTITQTPTSQDLYLYPTSDVSTELTPVGAANNYDCVNEERDVWDATTYVYTASTSLCTDIYTLENHTSETGTINSVMFYARAKSQTYNQSPSGEYKLIYDNNGLIESDNFNLTTDYNLFYEAWTSNPTDSTVWTWADIDAMKIHIKCSSPTIGGQTKNLILRPNNDSSVAFTPNVGGADNYEMVDEESADDITTYNRLLGINDQRDKFDLPDHTSETGTINSVTVHIRGRSDYPTIYISMWSPTFDEHSVGSLGTSWKNESYTWVEDPGGGAWIWTDIDNMAIGYRADLDLSGRYCDITQCYAVVNYTEAANPEIRTTQCFARVNYSPTTSTYYLTKPSSYTFSHSRKIGKINTGDGSRHVYDISRDTKTLHMEGLEWDSDSTATSRLDGVKSMQENGTQISIDGMVDSNLNTTWLITDFTYDNDEMNPYIYYWSMDCEKT